MFAVGWGANQFSSLLIAYRGERGLPATTADGLFGVYAVALIAALLLGGPAADRWGRRVMAVPAVAVSIAASALLIAGDHRAGLLFAGRFAAGLASGAIFAAGSSWMKELSAAPYDPGAADGAGARRAALALSLGFGLGPLAAGVIAQWMPAPLVSAYLPHLLIGAVALAAIWRVPETITGPGGPGYLARLKIRGTGQRRFRGVVLPAAVWVFAGPAVAIVVLPALVRDDLHGYALVFSGAAAIVTLGTGVVVQRLAHRTGQPGRAGGTLLGLAATVAGLLLSIWTAVTGDPALAIIAAVPLGAGDGLGLVSGLRETQRLAAPHELAGLTAVYYALTYAGFGLPLLLAWLHGYAGYPVMLAGVALVAALCGAAVWRNGVSRVPDTPVTLPGAAPRWD